MVVVSTLYSAFSGTDELTMNAFLNEIKRTRPLSVMRAEHVEGLRAWAKERTRPAN